MAPNSLRRSRAPESDGDASRSSTPASTTANDSKRIRRSSIDEETDGDGHISATEPIRQSSKLQPKNEPQAVITNGVFRTKPKHQPGAIVRIRLTNFVTYTSAEFFPGPNLNMVIGPNGTGKSTLVCAICLGLGWGTQYLGRAKDAAEFVKHGSREAVVEIELQRALRGKNASRSNPIITRTIKREGNKSAYTLNGQNATAKAVVELAKSFDIQIDNLCQFLPQDKVVEFAQMTPIEILQSTQRAAAPPHMLQIHEDLKKLRAAQKDANDAKKNDRETLANLENRQEMQRTEVERLRERVAVQKRLNWLHKCRPIPQFSEARVRSKEAKRIQKAATAALKLLKDESGPTLKKVEAKRVYVNQVKEHKQTRERDVQSAEKECDRLARIIENQDTIMNDCDQIEAAERKSAQPNREEINRGRVRIATLKKQKEQAPEPFDSRAMNNEIQTRVNRVREIDNRIEELKTQAVELKRQGNSRTVRRKQVKDNLEALSTVAGRQEDLLKSRSNDAYRAWDWIKKNRELFQKPVFGPPMVECTVKDPSIANLVESVLQQNDFRIFTVQCKEDFALLQRELNTKQRLHDVSFRTCPFDSIDSFRPPLSPDQMQRYGLTGWIIDYLDGPATVLAMLCQEKFLHQVALTDTDITQDQHDQLSSIPAVKGYTSRHKSYQFIRRAEFGAAGVHAKEKAVRRAEIWTSQPIDSGRRQQLEAENREINGEIQEIRTSLQELGKENDEVSSEGERLKEELRALKAEKDDKQKALTEYNSLDTKIAQAEEKVVKLKQSLEAMGTRLEENKRKRDEAMFAKADVVSKYCEAVHTLQEKTRAVIEVEVAMIEARNDFDVLSEHNQNLVKTLEEKRAEEKNATHIATVENKKAHDLMSEVKKLRDEGLELEEKEDDPGLSRVLEELSTMDEPKESDLDNLIDVEKAKLELTEGGDANTIKEYEERAQKIEQVRARLSKMNAKQEEVLHGIRELREQWEAPLDALIAKVSDAFGESFARIGCAGQVAVYKASSEDIADCTEEMGGSENGLDFANWAIHISVKFRENEPLSLLDSHRQSGGERAVSTIFYLMALQSLSRAPFRVVDEINQGMDPRNERMVHGCMVDIAAADDSGSNSGSQYFLITPKLLSGLKYKTGMTVLCIVSGENMPSAAATKATDDQGRRINIPGRTFDFAEFARKARSLGLNRSAGKRVDSGVALSMNMNMDTGTSTGASFDSLDMVRRSQPSVGA